MSDISAIPVHSIHPAIFDPEDTRGFRKCSEHEANIFIILDQDEKLYDWYPEKSGAERWLHLYSNHKNTVLNKVV